LSIHHDNNRYKSVANRNAMIVHLETVVCFSLFLQICKHYTLIMKKAMFIHYTCPLILESGKVENG